MSREKELNFFIKERNWNKGIEWYKSNFIEQSPGSRIKIYGESSPNYTNYPLWQGVPQRISSIVPNAKLVYVVRDPIERMISQYLHHYTEGQEHRPIEQAFQNPEESLYPVRSRYFFQLSQYLDYFPASQILVLTSEELARSPQKTMKQIFHFLDVDADFEFKFDLTKIKELLTFGTSILSPSFNFNARLHQSSSKRRRCIDESTVTQTISKVASQLADRLPIEVGGHVEKLMYLPFSRKIQRPSLDVRLRAHLLDYLAEDIDALRTLTGQSFPEWTAETKS